MARTFRGSFDTGNERAGRRRPGGVELELGDLADHGPQLGHHPEGEFQALAEQLVQGLTADD